MSKEKTIKAWAVMNQDERNGHFGILWHAEGHQTGNSMSLRIYAEEEEAIKIGNVRNGLKVVPVEIILKNSDK